MQANGTTITHPDKALILHAGDPVIVMGHRGDMPKFARKYIAKRRTTHRGGFM